MKKKVHNVVKLLMTSVQQSHVQLSIFQMFQKDIFSLYLMQNLFLSSMDDQKVFWVKIDSTHFIE